MLRLLLLLVTLMLWLTEEEDWLMEILFELLDFVTEID